MVAHKGTKLLYVSKENIVIGSEVIQMMALMEGYTLKVRRINAEHRKGFVYVNVTADFIHVFRIMGIPFRSQRFIKDYRGEMA